MITREKKPRLAVDIGGTFTDIAIEVCDRIKTAKTSTTCDNPVDGVVTGIGFALEDIDLDPIYFGSVIHGTTLATNALIERRGAKVRDTGIPGYWKSDTSAATTSTISISKSRT